VIEVKKRVLLVGYTDTGVVPLCAAILNHMCKKKGFTEWQFESCGFWAERNHGVDGYMLRAAGELGIDLTHHRARRVDKSMVQTASLVIPQDPVIWRGVRELLYRKSARLGKPAKLSQPIGGELEDYRRVRQEVLSYCRRWMRNLTDEKREDKKTMESLSLKRLQPTDVSQVQELEQECFAHPWSMEAILSELKKPVSDGCFVGAFVQDRLVGYGSLYKVGDEAFINNIAVTKKMRRKGIGHLLLNALITDCSMSEIATLSLEVRSKNLDAIRLYETHGFVNIGCRKRFYRDPKDDAVIMTLYLEGEPPVSTPYLPSEKQLHIERQQAELIARLYLITPEEAMERVISHRRPKGKHKQ